MSVHLRLLVLSAGGLLAACHLIWPLSEERASAPDQRAPDLQQAEAGLGDGPDDGPPPEAPLCSKAGVLTPCPPIDGTGCAAGTCYATEQGSACVCPEGTLPDGQRCTSSTQCQPRLVCVKGPEIEGVCRALCLTASGACASGDPCRALDDWAGLGYCDPGCSPWGEMYGCDPEWGSGCPAGACYLVKVVGTACVCPEGTLAEGDLCTTTVQCRPGLVCANESPPVCRRVCEMWHHDWGHGWYCKQISAFPAYGYCLPY